MKISEYRPNRPIILGSLDEDEVREKPSQAHIVSLQEPSTKAALLRNAKADQAWFDRPWPAEVHWKREVVHRDLDAQEIFNYLMQRRERVLSAFWRRDKNGLIDQSVPRETLPTLPGTPSARERAIAAFRFTPPAQVTKEQVEREAVGLVEYKSERIEVWIKLPWWKAMLHKIMGNPVKEEIALLSDADE